jgi:hypothetical protein
MAITNQNTIIGMTADLPVTGDRRIVGEAPLPDLRGKGTSGIGEALPVIRERIAGAAALPVLRGEGKAINRITRY